MTNEIGGSLHIFHLCLSNRTI